MNGTLGTALLVIFGLIILGSLITLMLSRIRSSRAGGHAPSQPRESRAEFMQAAVPWLIFLAVAVGLVLAGYWLMS